MEMKVDGDPVVDNLKNRQAQFAGSVKELAYERLKLIRRVEEIDKIIGQLEGAQLANDLTQKDIDLRETIVQAKREKQAAASAEAEAAKKNKLEEDKQNA